MTKETKKYNIFSLYIYQLPMKPNKKRSPMSLELRKQISESVKNTFRVNDTLRKRGPIISAGLRRAWKTPEFRAKQTHIYHMSPENQTAGKQRAKRKRAQKEFGIIYTSTKGITNDNTSNIPARHQYDIIAFQNLDKNPFVEKWQHENIIIQFMKKQTHSSVVVDVIVEYKDGSKKLICIEPAGFIFSIPYREKEKYPRTDIFKFVALQKYCNENNILLEIWTADNLVL